MRAVRPDRVAIYVRWSTDDQAEGTTLEVQLDGCRHYALSQGWQPRPELTFVDEGYSGSTLDRPALTRLRELIGQGEVDCVVVYKVDRLSRNIVDAVDLVLGEWRERCYFKSSREPIDTGNDLGRMIFSILAMFADFERSQIRERTQSGKIRRIAEGRQLHGEPAYGYRPAGRPGQWAEEPNEAALVRRIFRLAAAGHSAAGICRTLNGEGLRTRAGKAWSVRGLLWILHNRLYIGEVIYGRTRLLTGRGKRVARSEPVVHTRTEAAPPLIEEGLFRAAQAQLEQNRARRREHGPRSLASPHLLTGLARCRCGGSMVAKVRGKRVHYLCHGAREGRCSHQPAEVWADAAEAAILAQFWGLYGSELLAASRVERALAGLSEEMAGRRAQREALERQARQLAEQERRLLRSACAGEVALTDLPALRQSLAAEQGRLEARLAELDAAMAATSGQAEAIRDRLQADLRNWLSTEQQRRLLQMALAGPVILHRPGGGQEAEVELTWRC